MRFGLEAEKFIFNLEKEKPSNGVFRFLDALTDFQGRPGSELIHGKATNEFVLSMVEFETRPSQSPLEVLNEYLFNYLMIRAVALREKVAMVPMASLPMSYLPHMTPKWPYFVQNSILAQKAQDSWTMSMKSPLLAAGNCAGIHVHVEVETPKEFLYATRELQDKFNMGVMMTPMIAFGSSPYFFGQHESMSMRSSRYYDGVYKNFTLNGGLPPVANSSLDVLEFIRKSVESWIERGVRLGFSREDLHKLTVNKGANWNPVRWNRLWNTIEIRCLDSDSIDLDASKFVWVSGAMGRMDIKGEALQTRQIVSRKKVDRGMIDECFDVSGREVSILPTAAIQEVFSRATKFGTEDPLVERYLNRLGSFSLKGMDEEYLWAFKILKRVLDSHNTTSRTLLERSRNKKKISEPEAINLVKYSVARQDKIISAIKRHVPEVFHRLDEMLPKY